MFYLRLWVYKLGWKGSKKSNIRSYKQRKSDSATAAVVYVIYTSYVIGVIYLKPLSSEEKTIQ